MIRLISYTSHYPWFQRKEVVRSRTSLRASMRVLWWMRANSKIEIRDHEEEKASENLLRIRIMNGKGFGDFMMWDSVSDVLQNRDPRKASFIFFRFGLTQAIWSTLQWHDHTTIRFRSASTSSKVGQSGPSVTHFLKGVFTSGSRLADAINLRDHGVNRKFGSGLLDRRNLLYRSTSLM